MTGISNKTKGRAESRPASEISETDLANERMGSNHLQGDDQDSVHNQRHAVPDVKTEPEGILESFENLDPKVRAERQRRDGKR